MSSFEPAIGANRQDSVRLPALPVFIATIFTSAFLLFAVQPMFAKMVLPQLGGTPAVWSVAMVFFQGLLLLGYLYAHLLSRYLASRHAVLAHMALLVAAALALPVSLSGWFGEPPASGHAFWLLGVFTVSAGLPFFAVSANGPLLQAWFARTGHPHANDPYFLYGASNIGSFAALVLYPVLIEPVFRLHTQSQLWSLGFVLLAALISLSALIMLRASPDAAPGAADAESADAAGVTWQDRMSWAFHALVPSGLLVAVTAHISTDVAAAPFMWIVPLALFLLTFVMVFRETPLIRASVLETAYRALAPGLILFCFWSTGTLGPMLAIHLSGFLVIALLCHAKLYARRPPARDLTQFYLWMSFGGVIGGALATLVAPFAFNTVLEYPLLVAAAALVFAAPRELLGEEVAKRVFFTVCGLLLACSGFWLVHVLSGGVPLVKFAAIFGVLLCILAGLRKPNPYVYAAMLSCLALFIHFAFSLQTNVIAHRSFFGVHKITTTEDGRFRELSHGTTLHGAQELRDASGKLVTGPPEPLTYYHVNSPQAQALRAVRDARSFGLRGVSGIQRAGIVGLGSGSFACHKQAGESWTYFDIDPAVVEIARNPAHFNFLSACAPDASFVVGDARLTLAKETRPFSFLIIDAFSSDAIPVHLISRESIELYMRRLDPQGVLVMHISNRHQELETVVAAAAKELGLAAFACVGVPTQAEQDRKKTRSHVVALARDKAHFGSLPETPCWRPIRHDPSVRAWTDDYSNIIGALMRPRMED